MVVLKTNISSVDCVRLIQLIFTFFFSKIIGIDGIDGIVKFRFKKNKLNKYIIMHIY